jgi:RNA polymerase sigma factor (sigma-70 family)
MAIVLECASQGGERFRCAQGGCSRCMRSLLREHRGLVYRMVNRLAAGKMEYADLFQEGRIGMWRAILHYEAGRGAAFSSYACVVIQHHLWEVVKRSQKAEGWLEVEGREDDLERVVRVWQQEQIHQALGEELEVLPKRLRELIELRYGLTGAAPQNLAEIGRGWGLCRQRMHQLHEEALSLLRLPVFSIHLRSICERGERNHYRQSLCQNQMRQRKQRGQR